MHQATAELSYSYKCGGVRCELYVVGFGIPPFHHCRLQYHEHELNSKVGVLVHERHNNTANQANERIYLIRVMAFQPLACGSHKFMANEGTQQSSRHGEWRFGGTNPGIRLSSTGRRRQHGRAGNGNAAGRGGNTAAPTDNTAAAGRTLSKNDSTFLKLKLLD